MTRTNSVPTTSADAGEMIVDAALVIDGTRRPREPGTAAREALAAQPAMPDPDGRRAPARSRIGISRCFVERIPIGVRRDQRDGRYAIVFVVHSGDVDGTFGESAGAVADCQPRVTLWILAVISGDANDDRCGAGGNRLCRTGDH